MANRESTRQQAALVGSLYLSVAVMLFLPVRLQAQAKGTVSQNPVNPLALPIRFGNYPRPVRGAAAGLGAALVSPSPSPTPEPTPCLFSVTLSGSYQFLNQRSRVGDVSSDSQSAVIDLTIALNKWTYSCLDIAYIYSHGSGSSPADISQTANQHVGSLRLLQPLEPLFLDTDWKPAALSEKPLNCQLAIILGADYGGSLSSTEIPHLSSVHSSAYTFLGNALLDYQFAWFPNRGNTKTNCAGDYAQFFFELSSGIQFNTIRLDSSNRTSTITSSSRQLTYQNIASFNYCFLNRFGFLVAAEWDAPLYSDPLRGSQPYYANIAIFTGGLTYNYYPGRRYQDSFLCNTPWIDRFSLSLLYSYTAFDPLTEINQLQVQVSYAF